MAWWGKFHRRGQVAQLAHLHYLRLMAWWGKFHWQQQVAQLAHLHCLWLMAWWGNRKAMLCFGLVKMAELRSVKYGSKATTITFAYRAMSLIPPSAILPTMCQNGS